MASAVGRQRGMRKQLSSEDQALDMIAREVVMSPLFILKFLFIIVCSHSSKKRCQCIDFNQITNIDDVTYILEDFFTSDSSAH